MPATTTGSLAATGSVTLSKNGTDTLTLVQVSGTYTGVSLVFEGSVDSTNWFGLAALETDTGSLLTGTISPANSATLCWKLPSEGLGGVRLRVTAISTGSLAVVLQSNSFVGLPFTAGGVTNTTFSSSVTTPSVDASSGTLSIGTSAASGISMSKAGNTTSIAGLVAESATDSITAHSGGTQAAALALTTEVNRVATVAAPADSVKLPASAAGLTVYVMNHGASTMQVFGAGTDTINDVATATGVAQMANSMVIYTCATAGAWYSEGLATGYGGPGLQTLSFTPTVTAFSGGGQASATPLTAMFNRVSTVAAVGDSVRLPASAPGLEVMIVNRGANSCQVFGAGTDTINGIATATGVSQGVATAALYTCAVTGNWEAPLTSLQSSTPSTLSVNGAIPAHTGHTYVITKAGVLADTLAAPTAGTDDGIEITITSDTANAHTLTATGLLDTGTASVNLATFAAFKGAGLTLMAFNGRWKVLSAVGITFS